MASVLRSRLVRLGCGTLLLLVTALAYIVRLVPRYNHPPHPQLSFPLDHDHRLSAVGASPGGEQQADRKDPPDQCGDAVRQRSRQPVSVDDLTSLGPLKFRKDYKNPCWRAAEGGETRCLPYFYLAGFPKCGTTDLHRRLDRHPDIMRKRNVMHWINMRSGSPKLNFNFTEYTRSLAPSDQRMYAQRFIVGDYTVSTAWDNYLWPLFPGNENCSEPNVITADYIRQLNPRAKIIIKLRNPTDRLYSSFMYFRRAVLGNMSQQEQFHEKEVVHPVAIFNECRKTRSLRSCAYNSSLFSARVVKAPLSVGMYSVYLDDWLLRFPRDQILVLRLEDPGMEQQLRRVFRFLGVDEPDPDTMKHIVNQKPANVGENKNKHGPMLEETRQILDRFYRPFNQRLADILGDRKYLWEDSH